MRQPDKVHRQVRRADREGDVLDRHQLRIDRRGRLLGPDPGSLGKGNAWGVSLSYVMGRSASRPARSRTATTRRASRRSTTRTSCMRSARRRSTRATCAEGRHGLRRQPARPADDSGREGHRPDRRRSVRGRELAGQRAADADGRVLLRPHAQRDDHQRHARERQPLRDRRHRRVRAQQAHGSLRHRRLQQDERRGERRAAGRSNQTGIAIGLRNIF